MASRHIYTPIVMATVMAIVMFISGWSFEDDLIIVIQGQHNDLVLGEMFWNVSISGKPHGPSGTPLTR